MKLRKLRIGWSVAWGVVAMLLIVLWVRSYRTTDIVIRRHMHIESGIGFFSIQFPDYSLPPRWQNINSDDYHSQPGHTYATGFPGRTRSKVWGHFAVNRYYRGLCVPFWFLALVSATVGYSAWLPFRFSLRTLLIATTLAAIVLGMIVWASRSS